MSTAGTPSASQPQRVFTDWYASTHDGYSHAATAAGFTEGARRRRGQFETVCGLIICVAALVAPCGPHCLRPCRHASPNTRQARLGHHAYGACA
jgi:hypothetical protein